MADAPRQVFVADRAARELQDAQRAFQARRALLPDLPLGRPAAVVRGDTQARLGEPCVVDPTSGALTVSLPRVERGQEGAVLLVVNDSASTNVITVRGPSADVLISGAATYTRGVARSVIALMVLGPTAWHVVGVV
jgi:hypothetical protein